MNADNQSDPTDIGLIFACRLDGKGGGTELALNSLKPTGRKGEVVWAHFDHEISGTRSWLLEQSGLDSIVQDALLADNPRPRSEPHGNGLILILRGINPNPGEVSNDMVSIRLWLEPHRIVSMRHRRILAATDLRTAIAAGKGPSNTNQFIVQLLRLLMDRMDEEVDLLNETVDNLEQQLLDSGSSSLRSAISQTRIAAITLRRYIAPQRQAMNRLAHEEVDWITDLTRANLREITDRLLKNVEELDAVRERASIIHEELSAGISERMNATMYLISICTVLFLPLGFLTGLLGINVGGMPGTSSDSAFWWVCGVLSVITVLVALGLKKSKWI